ncbi:MAG: type II secretion system secretin GspD, partial [Cellvibrionales bacterium]|nr:type II secretion system secretin GspD [Cellvibrionales bacterium]
MNRFAPPRPRTGWTAPAARLRALLLACLLGLPPAAANADTVSINFRDADIRSVIEAVAEITGRSFVLDPRVRGKITIISPQPIAAELLYEAVLSALQVQGFQAVNDGAIIRVVPFSQSFQIPRSAAGELQTKVLRVEHVKATEMLPLLKPIMSKGALLQAYDLGNNLVITDLRSKIVQLEQLLAQLDLPEQSDVEVIGLTHISAGEALHIATQMKSLQQHNLSIIEDSFNNRVIVGGPRIGRAAFRRMLATLDVPAKQGGGVEVLYLNYSKAEEIKPILDGMLESETFLRSAGESTGRDGKSRANYRIEVEPDNNALVVAASAPVVAQLRAVVRKLDRPRLQVLIEAVIAEVSEDQANRLTTQLVAVSQNTGGVLTNFDELVPSLLGLGLSDNITAEQLGTAAGRAGVGTFWGGGKFDSDTGKGIGVLIEALKTDTRTTILSAPSVVALDNEEASLNVGQEVPFITGSFTNNNNSSTNPFQTIEREEVGVKIKVTPQINDAGTVRLEIEQESSSIATTTTSQAIADVVTNKSTIITNVMVTDGEVLVLGGLMDGQFEDSETKVPLLGDIPLLGRLFRSSNQKNDQGVLMIFIRPTILRSVADARAVTRERFEYLRTHDLSEKDTGDPAAVRGILEGFGEKLGTPTDPKPTP